MIAGLGKGRGDPHQQARKERDNLSQSEACNGAGFRKAHRHVRPSVSLTQQPEKPNRFSRGRCVESKFYSMFRAS
ncbi:hypothetical protein AGRO_4218 [Agrobacterium sp. ATCC 31749]|nr:hypothetical protein AGRO_4218 [Agrobacterium sp. ATCC 31749]